MNVNINETSSISDVVSTFSKKISEEIIDRAIKLFDSNKIYYSPITNTIYVSEKFIIDTFEYADDKMPPSLTIDFIIYNVDNVIKYNELVEKEKSFLFNSESDYKKSYIKIVSAFLNNELMDNFYENVYHEVAHIYQYAQGMQKKVDLYDEVIKLNNSKDDDEKNVGYSLYFTFKHEQDAMTHQFYALLNNYDLNLDDFEYFLMKYSEYKNAISSLNKIKLINNEKLKNILNKVGLSISQYNKRIHYSYKRFKRKLYNAFKLSFYKANESQKHLIGMYNIGKELMYEEVTKKLKFKPEIKIENIYIS